MLPWDSKKIHEPIVNQPVSPSVSELKKTIVFHSCFLENSENFLNFAKISKKFGEFLNFLGFSKIIEIL